MGFKTKIYITIAVLLFTGYATFTILTYSKSSEILSASVRRNLNNIVENNIDYLQVWKREKFSTVVASSKIIGELGTKDKDAIMAILKGTMLNMNSPHVFIGYENGGGFIDGGGFVPPKDYDYTTREWYRVVKETMKPHITDIYTSRTDNEKTLTIAAPIITDGKFVGVLGANVRLNVFTRRSQDVNIRGGYIFFLDHSGLVIGHPREDMMNQKLSTFEGLGDLSRQIYADKSGIAEYKFGGEDRVMIFGTVPDTGWKVCATISKDIAYESLGEQLKALTLMSTIAIILTLVVVIYVLSILFKPLNRLACMIKDLGQGEGDLTKRIDCQGKDELAVMGKDVNLFIKNPKFNSKF